MHCQKVVYCICHRCCQDIEKYNEKKTPHQTRYTASFVKLEVENIMCTFNRKQKKNNLKMILITCVVPIGNKKNLKT